MWIIGDSGRRGRPLGRGGDDRVKEYMCERCYSRGWNKQGGSIWIERGRNSSAMTTSLGDISGGNDMV